MKKEDLYGLNTQFMLEEVESEKEMKTWADKFKKAADQIFKSETNVDKRDLYVNSYLSRAEELMKQVEESRVERNKGQSDK